MPLQTDKLATLRIQRQPQRRSVAGFVVLSLLVLLVAGGAFWWWRAHQGTLAVRTVLVSEGSGGPVDRTRLNASGYVTARRGATVSSKVTGKVIEVLVEEGKRVEEGQILARLDASNIETTLKLTEAQLESNRRALGETQANLTQAKRELQHLTDASSGGAASQLELDRAETNVHSLEARLLRQQAEVMVGEEQVNVWKQQLDDMIIRAPFAGIVTAKNAQPGEMISPMSVGGFTRTGICTLVDMSSLEIEVDVSESYINRVEAGMPVEAILDSYPNWRIPANVIAIIPTADRQKATVKVRVGFKQLDPRILPDMSVKVAFQDSATSAAPANSGAGASTISIPASALARQDDRDVVWVVRDGKAERRAVTVAEKRGEVVIVAAGLTGGERVVIEPPTGLADGAGVKETRQ